ncbi:MAG: hypothetical protein AB1449_12905 [Chloroflexota bacterium]
MPLIDGVLFCDRCGAEIVGAPVMRGKLRYCCEDCANGLGCECALILEDDRRERGETPGG